MAATSPAWAEGEVVSAATSSLPMIALGGLAALGIGAAVLAFSRKTQVERDAVKQIEKARRFSDTTSQALDALLLDRADGAAIWTGRRLQMAIGAAEPLSDLDGEASLETVAGLLAAPAFSTRIADALTALIDDGIPFEHTVNAPETGSRTIVGRTLGGRAMVSLIEGRGEGRALTADEARMRRADALHGQLAESFDHAPLIAWRRDAEGKLLWVNRAYVDAVESSNPEDVIAHQTELVFGDDADLVLKLAEGARLTSRPKTARATTVVGGARQVLEFREVPVSNGSLGFATDVTAQAGAAEALQQQIEANEATLDRLKRGVAVFSQEMTLTYFNDTVAGLWQIEPAWLQTSPSLRDVLNALRERSNVPQTRDFSSWRAEVLERYSKLTEPHETHWFLPNGVVLHLLAQPHPRGGLLLVFEDASAIFEMKRDMATVSAVQKAAFSRLREGVLVLGLDGRQKLANEAFCKQWNLTEEMLDEVHIREIAAMCEPLFGEQAVWSKMIEFVSAATEARGTWHEELHRTDGTILGMAGTVLPDGATMFAYTDITDSVNKERTLREQNEKLEELSGLKSAFLDGIHGASQELKIPLNTIVGFSEILGQEIFGELNERQREYITGVSTAANDLRLLVSGITDLAMIQADDFPFRVEPIHLKTVIEATVRFIERSVTEPITLRVNCPDSIGEVPGDAPRFREIMHNLINAVRTDTDNKHIIEIGVRREESTLVLWIGAEGAELSSGMWDKLEDSLHGLDAPPLQRDGLGVALVRQFVERQGGTISREKGVGGTREAVVCRFLTDEADVRAALNRRRARAENGKALSDWEDADSASRA